MSVQALKTTYIVYKSVIKNKKNYKNPRNRLRHHLLYLKCWVFFQYLSAYITVGCKIPERKVCFTEEINLILCNFKKYFS